MVHAVSYLSVAHAVSYHNSSVVKQCVAYQQGWQPCGQCSMMQGTDLLFPRNAFSLSLISSLSSVVCYYLLIVYLLVLSGFQ